MHITEKRTSAYKDLSLAGVYVGELRARLHAGNAWSLNFKWSSHVQRSEAKRLMTEFLKEQYEAFDISFYGRVGEYDKAYVIFKTWSL
jgi:hypothetical protein